MLVSDLINEVNSLADDQIASTRVLAWVNDGFAAIGSEAEATFPHIKLITEDLDLYLPYKWQRLLIKTYATARLKEQDSSQFEYQDLYSQFSAHLSDYVGMKDIVPVRFRDLVPGTEITVNGATMYTEPGDTIYSIAQDEGVTPDSIIAENTDANGNFSLSTSGGPAQPTIGDNWYRWDN